MTEFKINSGNILRNIYKKKTNQIYMLWFDPFVWVSVTLGGFQTQATVGAPTVTEPELQVLS